MQQSTDGVVELSIFQKSHLTLSPQLYSPTSPHAISRSFSSELKKEIHKTAGSELPIYAESIAGFEVEEEILTEPIPWTNLSIPAYIHVFLSDESFSRPAHVWSIIIVYYILLSTLMFALQTLPQYRNLPTTDPSVFVFWTVEFLTIIIFTVEYGVRFLTSPFVDWNARTGNLPHSFMTAIYRIWFFVKQPLNIVDLLAFCPFFVEIFIHEDPKGFPFLRLVRLVRIFRLFKLHKYSLRLQLILRVMYKTRDILEVLILFTAFAAIIVGSLMWFAEGGEYDPETDRWIRLNADGDAYEETPFKSIFHSFYFVFQTVTTVTFGDLYPTTFIGRIVAIVAMHLGIIMLALPVAVLGTHFTNEYIELKKRLNIRKKVERKSMSKSHSVSSQTLPPPVGSINRSYLHSAPEMAGGKPKFKVGQHGCKCQCTCQNKKP